MTPQLHFQEFADTSSVKDFAIHAVRMFNSNDKHELPAVNLYEPVVSHRIAVYLEILFTGYAVDCEYNKNVSNAHDQYKRSLEGRKIRPDIIVHKRNDSTQNLLVVEVKKAGKDSEKGRADIMRIKESFRQSNLSYCYGMFVGVLRSRIDVVWVSFDAGEPEEYYEVIK